MRDTRPDETVCREVLQEVYLYLDLECADDRRTRIRRHLDHCSHCLREYGIEQEVKQLVSRCCGEESAPQALRERVRSRLADVMPPTDSREMPPTDSRERTGD